MKKMKEGTYIHRGHWIMKDDQGIFVEKHSELFRTVDDAKEFIDKIIDGTNEREPEIVGMWEEVEEESREDMIYRLEKRHEFGGGTMETHWEVISYTGISKIGVLLNGKTLKKGTKAQCQKYCRVKGIQITA